MPLYEHRKGGKTVERVRTVSRSFEDTRLGLMAGDTRPGSDGWHLAVETNPAEKPKGDTDGG